MTTTVERNQAHTLCDKGDSRITWDPTNPDETKAAKEHFDALTKKKKHLAYRTDRRGQTGERLREFDPRAEQIIFVPQTAGG